MSFFKELKRRNVFRVGIAYAVATWLLIQVTDILVPTLGLPEWISKATIFLLIIGFIPALIFAWAFELTPEGLKREREVDRTESITPVTGRKLDFAIIALLAAAVVYFAWDKFVLTDPEPEVAQQLDTAGEPEAAAETAEKSIAVLPFVNMSDDASNEFFSDGISEEILNALAKVRELKVAGRTSSFSFKGKDQDLRVIGEALGVNHILEGSVRKAGNQVRITAQLIRVDNGFHLWSEAYDRELDNVFAIQDEISTAILEQLKLQLLEGEESALAATTTDPRAYELFLLAKQRIYDRNKLSLEAAVGLLESVIEIDPDYAPALAQRGIAEMLLAEDQYGEIPRNEANETGKAFLDRALALDPGLAEAWAGLGLYHTNVSGGHFEAIEKLEKALSINPALIDASNWLQIAYGDAGQTGKVLPILEDMLERDPLYRPAIGNATLEFNRLGMQERSLAIIERARPFIPDDAHLMNYRARTLRSLGKHSEALPMIEEAVKRQPTDGVFWADLAVSLLFTHQYERMLDPNISRRWRVFALTRLDRREEATILAYEEAADGFPGPLLDVFASAGRYSDIVKYVEERWPDMDAYEADFPRGRLGHGSMLDMALAYSKTGNPEKFRDAMSRVRNAHNQLIEEGVQHQLFFWREARYYAMANDYDKAIEQLGVSIDMGQISSLRIAQFLQEFEPLEGDPRFEALQAKMIENLNYHRAELGLEPATI